MRRINRGGSGFSNAVRCMSACAVALFVTAFAAPSHASGIIAVTSISDNDVSDGICTLREAIIAVNSASSYHGCTNPTNSSDQIFLPSGAISLGSSLPTITKNVAITGGGYAQTFINGNNSSAILGLVAQGSFLGIADLTVQDFLQGAVYIKSGASGSLSYAKIANSGDPFTGGGCIRNEGSLTISDSQLERCHGFTGGALYNLNGTTSIFNSTILKCDTEHSNIVNDAGQLFVYSSTIGANKTLVGAGAIMNQSGGSVAVRSSTIAYNFATNSSASNSLSNAGGTFEIGGSVVFATQTGNDCIGTITSDGYNEYVSGRGCSLSATGDRLTTDPRLQPITVAEDGFTNLPRAAGGVGRVYLPATNSDLLDKIPAFNGFCAADQRASSRFGGPCDIGSVERANALLVVGNTTLSAGDTVLKAQLEGLGFAVSAVSDVSSNAGQANGKTLVVLSESVSSANVNTKFRDVSTGVLVLEPSLLDDMMMTTTANLGTENHTQINLVRGRVSSRIGIVANPLTVTSVSVAFGYGVPQAIAENDAQSTGTASRKHIFEYFTDSVGISGFHIPGMRLSGFATDAAAASLNANGLRILQETMLLAARQN